MNNEGETLSLYSIEIFSGWEFVGFSIAGE